MSFTSCWNEICETQTTVPKIVQETTDKTFLIRENFRIVRNRQKTYADKHRKPLEFQVNNPVLHKVSPWKGVLRFRKRKVKLVPRYIDSLSRYIQN